MEKAKTFNDEEKELNNCVFVKTVLMLLVVLYHSCVFWQGDWFTKNPVHEAMLLNILSQWLNSFHIYGFALVSGYVFYYLRVKRQKYQRFMPYMSNKIKRLLVPYAFISTAWVIPVTCFFLGLTGPDIVTRFVLAESPGQLWFLVMLFLVYMIFWPLTDFFCNCDYLGLLVALGCYGISLLGNRMLPNIFQIWTAFKYIPFFWLGLKICQKGTGGIFRFRGIVYVVIHVVLFMLVLWLRGMPGTLIKLLHTGLSFLLYAIGAIMAFTVLQKIAGRVKWKNRFFEKLSQFSMAIYLLHQQVIYFVINALNGRMSPYIIVLINFGTAVGVSVVITSVLMRFKLGKVLLGEKA